jgi:hypothetical protein
MPVLTRQLFACSLLSSAPGNNRCRCFALANRGLALAGATSEAYGKDYRADYD